MNAAARIWFAGLNRLRHPSLHREALFVAAATIFSGLGSLIYWKLITLRFPAEVVGLASAGITSATYLGGLANLGLAAGLVRFLPGQDAAQKSGLARAASGLSLGLGLLISLGFLAGRQIWAAALFPPQTGPVYLIIFAILLLSIAQLNLNTASLQAERRAPYLLFQSLLINIVQVTGGALIVVHTGATGILLTSMLPIFATALVFSLALPYLTGFSGKAKDKNETLRPQRTQSSSNGFLRALSGSISFHLFGEMLRYSLGSQVFNVIWLLPSFIFPLITLAQLGAQAGAGLALTWYAYTFLAILPNALLVALLVDGSHEPEQLSSRLWEALLTTLSVLTPVILLVMLLAPWLLGFFGKSYALAAPLLRLLALSLLPMSVNGLYATFWRVRKQMLRLNLFAAALTASLIALSILLIPRLGLAGIGWSWLIGQGSFALVTLTLIARERKNDLQIQSQYTD